MDDELYLYHEDLKERKSIAYQARHRRGKTGKRGSVKLPTRTKKEMAEMNGECVSYNVRAPMTWAEFKRMPDDLKEEYLLWLRERFNVPMRRLGKMFGTHYTTVCKEANRLRIPSNKPHEAWDEKGFYEWSGLAHEEKAVEPVPQEVTDVVPVHEEVPVSYVPAPVASRAVPGTGSMVFEGMTEDILEAVRAILGGARVHMNITWDVLED